MSMRHRYAAVKKPTWNTSFQLFQLTVSIAPIGP
jgi:hypothetical protein